MPTDSMPAVVVLQSLIMTMFGIYTARGHKELSQVQCAPQLSLGIQADAFWKHACDWPTGCACTRGSAIAGCPCSRAWQAGWTASSEHSGKPCPRMIHMSVLHVLSAGV
jgi:hypothetical protein